MFLKRSHTDIVHNKAIVIVRSVAVLCILMGIFIGACSNFNHNQMALSLPVVPGAEYIGPEICADCHEVENKYFNLSEHAAVAISITDEQAEQGQAEACETCHGPGSLHVEEMGDKSKIVRADPQTCFGCHLDIKGKFLLQHSHPVLQGRMTCSDCHSMHGRDVRATGAEMLLGKDEKCFTCHKDQRGPFIFEHDAMREGCQVCHNPHGSISDKMLVAGQTTTCIRCHWQSGFNTSSGTLGDTGHGSFADIGRGAECIDCHTAVHGSNISRDLRR